MLNKKSVDDINVKGQKVLVRCDFNVPLQDGKITDENRLVAALPTIKKLIADGGKVILCSHLGKPKGEPKPELSLAPVAVRLSELLGQRCHKTPSSLILFSVLQLRTSEFLMPWQHSAILPFRTWECGSDSLLPPLPDQSGPFPRFR